MFASQLAEIWIWYGFVMLVVAYRLISKRIRTKSWELHADDWLLFFAVCFFTASVILDTEALVYRRKLRDAERADVDDLISVLRLFLILYDHFTLATLWFCKATVLVLFWRQIKKYGENLMVKLIAIFVAASYIFVVVAYVCVWCRPPSDYLDPESSDDECRRPQGHLISVAALEISTDFLLLALALLLSFQVGVARLKRNSVMILVIFVFATIAITITNRVLAIADDDYTLFTWNIRECALAITAVNLAGLIPYWRHRTDRESPKDMNGPSKTSSWRHSWRPNPKQNPKDVMEIASGNMLWKDVAPKNMADRNIPGQDIRNSNQVTAEREDARAESPIDRLHMGTISSMSTSSWLNIDGD